MWLVVKWWLSTLISWLLVVWTSLVAQVVKNLPAVQVWVQSLCWEVSPGEGNGFPLRYSCLENSTDRGAWRATTERLTQHGCLLPYARVFPFPFIHSFIYICIFPGSLFYSIGYHPLLPFFTVMLQMSHAWSLETTGSYAFFISILSACGLYWELGRGTTIK